MTPEGRWLLRNFDASKKDFYVDLKKYLLENNLHFYKAIEEFMIFIESELHRNYSVYAYAEIFDSYDIEFFVETPLSFYYKIKFNWPKFIINNKDKF